MASPLSLSVQASCDYWKVGAAADETISTTHPDLDISWSMAEQEREGLGVLTNQQSFLLHPFDNEGGKKQYWLITLLIGLIFVFDHRALPFIFLVSCQSLFGFGGLVSEYPEKQSQSIYGKFFAGEGDEGSPPKPLVFARPIWILLVLTTHTQHCNLRWGPEQCQCQYGLVNNSQTI